MELFFVGWQVNACNLPVTEACPTTIPAHQSTLSSRAFAVMGPMVCNLLPYDLNFTSLSCTAKSLQPHILKMKTGTIEVQWTIETYIYCWNLPTQSYRKVPDGALQILLSWIKHLLFITGHLSLHRYFVESKTKVKLVSTFKNDVQCFISVGDDSDQAAAVTLIDEYQLQLSSKTMNRQGLCVVSLFITFANKVAAVMWYSLSVCFSNCLPPGYLKKLLTDLNQILWNVAFLDINRITQKVVVHEIFGRNRPSDKEHSVRFWDFSIIETSTSLAF